MFCSLCVLSLLHVVWWTDSIPISLSKEYEQLIVMTFSCSHVYFSLIFRMKTPKVIMFLVRDDTAKNPSSVLQNFFRNFVVKLHSCVQYFRHNSSFPEKKLILINSSYHLDMHFLSKIETKKQIIEKWMKS